MNRRRSTRAEPPRQPWTADELEQLRLINRIGLACWCWHLALPSRRFGEITDKRRDLRERGEIPMTRRI